MEAKNLTDYRGRGWCFTIKKKLKNNYKMFSNVVETTNSYYMNDTELKIILLCFKKYSPNNIIYTAHTSPYFSLNYKIQKFTGVNIFPIP